MTPEALPGKAPAAPAVADELVPALAAWRQRLNACGVVCHAAAFHSADPRWTLAFPDAERALVDAWANLRKRVSAENPVALGKASDDASADLLLATSLQLPGGQPGIVGARLAPPHNERTIQQVLLSLGWLQLALSAASLAHNQRAARLLELMGHVGAQDSPRAAAQEWVNRTAAWARAEAPGVADSLMLVLFEVRQHTPHWWVAADTAWAEKASTAVQEAGEIAQRALVETQEIVHADWWALPLHEDGEPAAVLVARNDLALPADLLALLRASAGLAEPLLRHWREARRSLPRHALQAVQGVGRKLVGPGHLTWKLAAIAIGAAMALLLLLPVPDRVTAATVIEGRTRQLVTSPQEGFIAQVDVRPGEKVTKGQRLARLDDRDLLLEQQRWHSERDQAAGKLRQAMAERDGSALALAATELQSAEAQLALAEARLVRTTLLAPMDGLVVSGDWVQQIGSPVEAGKQMFEIAATDGYRVVLHVSDAEIARIKPGQPGVLRLTGQPQTGHAFEVTRVTATASVEDGSNGFRVEAMWRGDVPPLSPGMQGVGKVEVGQASLLAVWTRPSIDWLRLKLWRWWW
jgi:multidrug resistance efflux pump